MTDPLHDAMTHLDPIERRALARAAAEHRDAAVTDGSHGMAGVWQQLALAATEVEDDRRREVRELDRLYFIVEDEADGE